MVIFRLAYDDYPRYSSIIGSDVGGLPFRDSTFSSSVVETTANGKWNTVASSSTLMYRLVVRRRQMPIGLVKVSLPRADARFFKQKTLY